jgi:cell division protein FtsA
LLKLKAGSALSNKVKENDISTVRLKGEPKEVSVKNLARIIQARMEEILDMVLLEIKNSGLEGELKKGVVLCGGGAQLKNLDQLISRYTGLTARIGYPVEKLAGG